MKTTLRSLLPLALAAALLPACADEVVDFEPEPTDTPCEAGSFRADENAACSAWAECGVGEYEATAPTAVSDRVCASHSLPCEGEEYESAAATPSSDRECAPLTACGSDEYESMAATPTSDRACAPLTACGEDEYESVAATPTSDRACAPYVVTCVTGEYEVSPPTPTSDRACAPYVVACVAGEYEVSPRTPTSDRVCEALTTCGPSEVEREEVAEDGSATADRECCVLHEGNVSVGGDFGWPAWDAEGAACVVVDGELYLQGQIPPLETPIVAVWRRLRIMGTDLEDLSMFSELVEVRGWFVVNANPQLKALGSFSALKTVGGYFQVSANPVLTHIGSFPVLKELGTLTSFTDQNGYLLGRWWSGGVVVYENDSLTRIEGFPVLEKLSALRIDNNPALTYLGGFDAHPSLRFGAPWGEGVFIRNNAALCQSDAVVFAHFYFDEDDSEVFGNGADAVCD